MVRYINRVYMNVSENRSNMSFRNLQYLQQTANNISTERNLTKTENL